MDIWHSIHSCRIACSARVPRDPRSYPIAVAVHGGGACAGLDILESMVPVLFCVSVLIEEVPEQHRGVASHRRVDIPFQAGYKHYYRGLITRPT